MIECLTPWYLILNFFAENNCAEIYNSGLPTDPITLSEYLPYFLKTFILEFPIYALILKSQQDLAKTLAANTILNVATHPFIFILLPLLLNRIENINYLHYLVVAEIFAPTVEILLLKLIFKIKPAHALIAGLAANLFSWSVGVYWL